MCVTRFLERRDRSLTVMTSSDKMETHHVSMKKGGYRGGGDVHAEKVGWPPTHISILEHVQVGELVCIVTGSLRDRWRNSSD